VLRPPLDLCTATGVTLAKGSRVIVMVDRGGVAKALVTHLEKAGATALMVEDAPAAEELGRRVQGWLADGPIQGVYWLPALDREPELSATDLAGWREALRVRAKLLYTTLHILDDGMDQPGRFLVAATRLGGRHGYDDADVPAPAGGVVTGLVKAYRRERTALVKAVDFEAASTAAEIAEELVAETLGDPGAVEVGHAGGLRWTVGLAEEPAADGQPGLALDHDTVFVVTGAAGGIVSAIVGDLAAASGGVFHLLDRVPEPSEDDPDLARLAVDRDGLKRDLAERLRARGERPTPALVERELGALERSQAALDALRAVHSAGGTASYHAVDLVDPVAVAAVVDEIRRRHGRIDVLLHAAGIEVSHLIAQKPAVEFDRVLDVKCDGWFNLLHAARDIPLAAVVVFSSIAARFGNRGQTDYSAANDLLCKWIAKLRTTRPETRAIAIDWTAWADIGMASRGSIPTAMAAAGIDMLLPDTAIPIVRRELTTGGTRGEVVIADRLGVLLEEWDATGGLEVERAQRLAQGAGPMIGSIVGMGVHTGLAVETVLDPRQPFLGDHRIDGTPVLPGVMGIEAFAELASLLGPDWHVRTVEDVRFLAPFKLYRDEPRRARLEAVMRADGDGLVADCRLLGSRTLAGQQTVKVTTYFTARLRLDRTVRPILREVPPRPPDGTAVTADDIYRIYFHGPAYRVLERVWRDGDRVVGLMARGLPADVLPGSHPTRLAPRLIELCFQTAGIAEIARTGRMGLPDRIDQVSSGALDESTTDRLFAVVDRLADGGFDAHVVDGGGRVHVALLGYRTVELPSSVAVEQMAPLQPVAG
jgi:NAD(P)-dependent dehydrogenase (short-subunit alcohol dehydrogenase family)